MTIQKRLTALEQRTTEHQPMVFFEKADGSIFDLQHQFHFADKATFEIYADEHFADVILFTRRGSASDNIPNFLKPDYEGD